MVDYMLANENTVPANFSGNTDVISSYHQQLNTSNSSNVERTLSFADVMQLAEFGHQQSSSSGRNTGIDPAVVSFLKFPVLSHDHNQMIAPPGRGNPNANAGSHNNTDDNNNADEGGCAEFNFGYDQYQQEEQAACGGYGYYPPLTGTNDTSARQSQHCSLGNPVQLEFLSKAAVAVSSANTTTADHDMINSNTTDGRDKIGAPANTEAVGEGGGEGNGKSSSSSKRKRPRTIKTSEEVESQRMTHIAVERNRRKQMNEHLRVLRSLMPSSYVQRGDQASIIGGAIEFVRELEQLLQCLESQKRRRLYGDHQQSQARPVGGDSSSSTLGLLDQPPQQPALPLGFPPLPIVGQHQQETADDHQLRLLVDEQNQLQLADPNNNNSCTNNPSGGVMLREETAESKSCIADIEVKVLGFDALIKILSRRRPGQLIKAIAALEDLHFTILHTNITTIEQTVLYSFNVQVATEARFNAEDIANSVQQIFTFIHANSNTI